MACSFFSEHKEKQTKFKEKENKHFCNLCSQINSISINFEKYTTFEQKNF